MSSNTSRIRIIKGDAFITINWDKVPTPIYKSLLEEGAKSYLNRYMFKNDLYSSSNLSAEALKEFRAKAIRVAEDNLKAIYNGSFPIPGNRNNPATRDH